MTTEATPRVLGWLGTGRMGAAMARRLVDDGESVAVWNRTKSKTAPLVARGATAVDRIADLGSCDIVFVMVSTPKDLEDVVAGPQGLLSGHNDLAPSSTARQSRPRPQPQCELPRPTPAWTSSPPRSAATRTWYRRAAPASSPPARSTPSSVYAPTSSRDRQGGRPRGEGEQVGWSSCVTTCTWA